MAIEVLRYAQDDLLRYQPAKLGTTENGLNQASQNTYFHLCLSVSICGSKNNMQIIGIVGGVASGKTLVARQFEKLGAGVLEADAAGYEVLRTPEVEEALRQRWGESVFGGDGRVDRARVAQIVFGAGPRGPQERKFLEQLLHPKIGELLRQKAEALAEQGCPVAVLDAPLLVEAGWDGWCDKVVFVDTPRAVRQDRAALRGWSEEDFAAREGVQESLDQKRARADVIIENTGSPESTQAQIERFWHSLVG